MIECDHVISMLSIYILTQRAAQIEASGVKSLQMHYKHN